MKAGVTRRSLLAGACVIPAAGCAGFPASGHPSAAHDRILSLVKAGEVPAAGLVVRRQGRIVFSFAAGLAQGASGEAAPVLFGADTKMRIASVSKMAVALATHRLSAAGVLDLDADVSAAFDPPLRHPLFPEAPVTLRQLLSHTAGLQDPDVYWIAATGRTESLFTPAMWRPADAGPPGSAFKYANFGYGLAAHVLERATNVRFDLLAAQTVFRGAGLRSGFNWSGVPRAMRKAGATLYAFEKGVWQPQADGPAVLAGETPSILSDAGFDLASYVPGTNGTLFSPQGGLRASLQDMITLARLAASEPGMTIPVWKHDPAKVADDTDAGYFSMFTAGAQIHPEADSPVPGVRLLGHHGEAYGLYSGVFHAPELDSEFAFAVTGTKSSGAARAERHPVIVKATEPLWESVSEILGSGAL
jgi:CubicO group peptidase (beta-lactamase class C family)